MHRRILVVDDVPDWQETLRDVLKSECDVNTVDSYEAAMDVVRRRETDLVIVDLRLSPTDESNRQGLQLLEQLAKHKINAIVLTGYADHAMQEEAEEKYKAFEFIDKSRLAGSKQLIVDVVHEAFSLLERKRRNKDQAIRDASNGLTVSFPDELSSWPLRKFRKGK